MAKWNILCIVLKLLKMQFAVRLLAVWWNGGCHRFVCWMYQWNNNIARRTLRHIHHFVINFNYFHFPLAALSTYRTVILCILYLICWIYYKMPPFGWIYTQMNLPCNKNVCSLFAVLSGYFVCCLILFCPFFLSLDFWFIQICVRGAFVCTIVHTRYCRYTKKNS